MYFITTKRMLEVCFSAHPNIQYRTFFCQLLSAAHGMRIVSCKLTSRKMRPIGGYTAEAAVI